MGAASMRVLLARRSDNSKPGVSMPGAVAARPAQASEDGSSSITNDAPTPPMTDGPRTPHTGSEEKRRNPTGRPNL